MMKTRWATAVLIVLSTGGCGCKGVQSEQDSIRAAIQQHLSGNSTLNLSAMDYEIKNASIAGDRAQAQVEFRLKQGGATMEVTYALARANGGWQILKSQPAGGQIEHPAMNDVHAPPAGGPPSRAVPSIEDFFQTRTTPGASTLPPGHPPVNSLKPSLAEKDPKPSPKKP